VKNKEITQRRVAAELYWLDEYLDNSTFLPDPESLVGEDGLDPIEDANYLDALATLRNPGLSVTQIHAALEPMTAEEINRLSTNLEQSIGPLLAAELEMAVRRRLDRRDRATT
ncbi:MAG: hypothetical protein ACO21M_11245, partial [Vulcanococcus sp.]